MRDSKSLLSSCFRAVKNLVDSRTAPALYDQVLQVLPGVYQVLVLVVVGVVGVVVVVLQRP